MPIEEMSDPSRRWCVIHTPTGLIDGYYARKSVAEHVLPWWNEVTGGDCVLRQGYFGAITDARALNRSELLAAYTRGITGTSERLPAR